MIDLAGAPIIDDHSHGFTLERLRAEPPAEFLDRIGMLGACLVSSAGCRTTTASCCTSCRTPTR